MSVTSGEAVTQADLDALAALANAVGAPVVDETAAFTRFDETLEPPTNVQGTINYGSGTHLAQGIEFICHIYSYKTISSRKHYSQKFAVGVVHPNNSEDDFEVDWTWDASTTAVDGYVYVFWQGGSGNFCGKWSEVVGTSFTDDETSLTDPFTGVAADRNPVEGWEVVGSTRFAAFSSSGWEPGPWLFQLNRLRLDLLNDPLAVDDPAWLVSGPWCVSVGSRLRYGTDHSVYGDVEFWYAADDHSGDVVFLTVADIGSEDSPYVFTTIGQPADEFHYSLTFNLLAANTAIGTIVWTATNAIAGGSTQALSVISGAATITTETWTIDGNTITLEFELSLPSGASQIDIDIDLSDGANSFVDSSSDLNRQTGSMIADVILDSETVAPSSVDAVHTTSLAKKAVPTVIDGSLGPITFDSVSYEASFHVQGSVEGVWVAMTRPVFGVHTLLQNDLPNYYSSSAYPSSDAEQISEDGIIVAPAVTNRAALWPVFRDTDAGEWIPERRGGGRNQDIPVPYWSGVDPFHTFVQNQYSLLSGAKLSSVETTFIDSGYEKFVVQTSDPLLTIYLSTVTAAVDPDNPATYDVSGVGEVRLPDDFTYAGGGTVWFTVKNTTANASVFYLRRIYCTKNSAGVYPGDEPIFFRTLSSGLADIEPYSYNLAPGTRAGTTGATKFQTPHSGYCIYRVVISRVPQVQEGGLFKTPSTGMSELVVSLGVVLGQTFDVDGTFEEFDQFTILANEPEVTAEVFWPVLKGAPLFYQATEVVQVQAFANFQPLVISDFNPPRGAQLGDIRGRFNGNRQPASPFSGRGTSYFSNPKDFAGPTVDRVFMPIHAALYNDTEALLNVL